MRGEAKWTVDTQETSAMTFLALATRWMLLLQTLVSDNVGLRILESIILNQQQPKLYGCTGQNNVPLS